MFRHIDGSTLQRRWSSGSISQRIAAGELGSDVAGPGGVELVRGSRTGRCSQWSRCSPALLSEVGDPAASLGGPRLVLSPAPSPSLFSPSRPLNNLS